MSIFEDSIWRDKFYILEFFENKENLKRIYDSSYYSSNGELQYKGTWFMYFELKELLEIIDNTFNEKKHS